MKRQLLWMTSCALLSLTAWSSDFAPAVPDLDLPSDTETIAAPAQTVAEVSKPKQTARANKQSTTSRRNSTAAPKAKSDVINVTNAGLKEEVKVEKVTNIDPKLLIPIPQEPVLIEEESQTAAAGMGGVGASEQFEPARDQANSLPDEKSSKQKVTFNPPKPRDPTLSPDDILLLKYREDKRKREAAAERQRKEEAERKRLAELERQRLLELEYLRDPSREVRGKIHINGIVGQEVFIGNKVYTVGKSVLGARIVSVQPDAVVFIYKGQKFTKTVQIK